MQLRIVNRADARYALAWSNALFVVALIIAGAAILSHTAPAPFLFEAFRPSASLWRVPTPAGAPPRIYLTFDDGPNPDWTPALLDELARQRVHATFFLIEAHITDETAPIVRRIAHEGHAIGLHTGTRRLMIRSPKSVAAELHAFAERIRSITGHEPCRLFRPHGGWRSASMYDGLRLAGFRLAGWTWGMWDWHWWQEPEGKRAAARISKKASSGDIVVIHDGHHKNPRADRRHAAEVVRLLAPDLSARGFTFERLCDAQNSR
jgi:peptidoglycan/xylan/chitin deacetylase (PgdA/CDA1 family)